MKKMMGNKNCREAVRRTTFWIAVCLSLLVPCSPLLLVSCSTTAKLPEGEVLYTGITEIAYGRRARHYGRRHQEQQDSTGVITAIADAYNTVEGLLSGNVDASTLIHHMSQRAKDHELSRQERDSLHREIAIYQGAMRTAQEEVNAALAYAPNNSVFGSTSARWPFPVGLWFYSGFVNDTTRFGRWVFDSFAARPRTISTANPRLRTQIARNTLRNYGFFHGRVEYEVQPERRDSLKARIGYSVFPGPLYRLGNIEYQRFGHTTDSLIRATADESTLHTGDPFTAIQLDAERRRLSTLFRNNGFYFYRPEHITFRADTLRKPLTAHLQVRPRPDMKPQERNRYYMGRTSITVLSQGDFAVTDSMLTRDGNILRWNGNTQKPPLRYGAIRHNLFYERGALYRQRIHELIQTKVGGMGIFSNVQMNYVPRDTTAACDTLDVNIFAVLDKPYDSELEAKFTNKTNGLLGPGIGWGMTKRNVFRGAETLNFKVYGSYEWQTGIPSEDTDRSLLNSFELGSSLTLTYPRLKFFGLARKLNRRAQASTVYKLDIDWMNRASYFQLISFGARLTYTYQRRRDIKHEFVPLRLDYNMLSHRSARFDSIMNSNQALYVSMRNQLVPSMSYTFTYAPRARDGHSRAIILGAKQAGNITNTIYSLCGRPVRERNKNLLGVPYAQFLKLTAEWRETFPVTARTAIAARAFLGAVWSYGNSTMAPYTDLFNVGGANSIRAFGVRTIGPGRYHPSASGWSYVDQVGNLKLELNAEYRFPVVGALSGAVFLDAGNVWLMQPDADRPGAAIDASHFFRDIALGTGAGLRYDLDFLVLRFDVGVGIHAPYDTGRSGYYNLRRFWDSVGFHLAVGYPF